jgi:hypothetical protein
MIKINQLIGKSLYKSINTQLRIDLTSNNITNDRGIFKFSLKLFSQKDYKEKFQSFAKQNELNSEQIQNQPGFHASISWRRWRRTRGSGGFEIQ